MQITTSIDKSKEAITWLPPKNSKLLCVLQKSTLATGFQMVTLHNTRIYSYSGAKGKLWSKRSSSRVLAVFNAQLANTAFFSTPKSLSPVNEQVVALTAGTDTTDGLGKKFLSEILSQPSLPIFASTDVKQPRLLCWYCWFCAAQFSRLQTLPNSNAHICCCCCCCCFWIYCSCVKGHA